MYYYKTINGWTKEKMKAQIRAKNNGSKSVDESGNICRYRGEEGNCCALGCFIPDEVYSNDMEGFNAWKMFEEFTNVLNYMPLDLAGMREIQRKHDATLNVNADMREFLCEWIDLNVEDGQLVCPLVNR